MGSDTLNRNPEIEDLYEKMILKLKELARLMDKSSARVLEQVNVSVFALDFDLLHRIFMSGILVLNWEKKIKP